MPSEIYSFSRSGPAVGCPPCPACRTPAPKKGTLDYAIMMARQNPSLARQDVQAWINRLRNGPDGQSPALDFIQLVLDTDVIVGVCLLWWHGDQMAKIRGPSYNAG